MGRRKSPIRSLSASKRIPQRVQADFPPSMSRSGRFGCQESAGRWLTLGPSDRRACGDTMGRVRGGVLLLALVWAAACAAIVDTEQLRICRLVVPALHPPQTEIHELRVAPAAGPETGVSIAYSAREPDTPDRPHQITCVFAGTAFEENRLDLVAVTTDEGPLGEARLLYLKRFWLSAFGAATAEQPRYDLPGVPQLPRSAAYAAQQLVNALALAAIYGLLATAYSLIYGLVGRINLAFGGVAAIGSYAAIMGIGSAVGLRIFNPIADLGIALTTAALLSGLWSWFIGMSIVAPLHTRHRHGQPILVATAAVAIVIEEILRLSQNAREHWLAPVLNQTIGVARAGDFLVTVTPIAMVVTAAALAAACGVLCLLGRTRFGREWRAFADDPLAAVLVGVVPQRLIAMTFVLAGMLAGLAGWVIAVYYGHVSFAMGTTLGLKALVAAVLGGIGSVPGACLGGVLVAVFEAAWSAYFDISFRDIVVFGLLIVVFVLRPGGLFGFSGPRPREV